MTEQRNTYLNPTEVSGAALMGREISGEVVMLNLLKFRDVADYSECPELAPDEPISGREAYERYMQHAEPYLTESGGSVLFAGNGGEFFIGPPGRGWDYVLLVRQPSVAAFFAFASNEGFKAGLGHREAALSDSRLLPLTGVIEGE